MAKGSFVCISKTATSIVRISGIAAHRVPRPIKINREHSTSENIARPRDREKLNPNIAGNCISPPVKIICNFGSPWVSIKDATPILMSNKAISTWDFLLFMEVNISPPALDFSQKNIFEKGYTDSLAVKAVLLNTGQRD